MRKTSDWITYQDNMYVVHDTLAYTNVTLLLPFTLLHVAGTETPVEIISARRG
jgi:hypothetical protein